MRPVITDGLEKKWTVFVGGAEVNDFLTDFATAEKMALDYAEDDYDDIVLYQYDTGEEVRL